MKDWVRCSDEELLGYRFCDLDVGLEDRFLSRVLERLQVELTARGFVFRPHIWLSDEWFCPDGVPGFAVPFYLAHPRLRRLERRLMLEVEGGTLRSAVRLMRHETGHAIDNAFRLRERKRRRSLFGSPDVPYPDFYEPVPFSRRFVRHLEFGYAQAHPDEDFAETFAVWLDPKSRWQTRYEGWPALQKLEYMEELMREVVGNTPRVRNRRTPGRLSSMRVTLREHYAEKRERFKVDFGTNYDEDLLKIFARDGEPPAASFLNRHRAALRRDVSRWTGIRCYTVDLVLRDWVARSRALGLGLRDAESTTLRNVTTALTVRVMQYLSGGHYRVAL
jgi:hypothetical protein